LNEAVLQRFPGALLIKQSDEHQVYRAEVQGRPIVLKVYARQNPLELRVYSLLEQLSIPTLPAIDRTENWIILPDLEHDPDWRLAEESDAADPSVGTALASWYRQLHGAGYSFLKGNSPASTGLQAWVDEIDEASLAEAAKKLGFEDNPHWSAIQGSIQPLIAANNSLPQTLNYNDFYYGNLAVSRQLDPMQVVVFDYDCFRTGTAYSDWRNVTYSLAGEGRKSFIEAYGAVSALEGALDGPLSELYGLVIAARHERLPAWAVPLVDAVRTGELKTSVERALAAAIENGII
jgi:hypothetical protein